MTQKYTSKHTSINGTKLPKTFTWVKDWKAGTRNLDYGGGKFDNATEYLAALGVENLVYDPYNRTEAHNASVISSLDGMLADTVTCNNVLNVIDDDQAMRDVLRNCAAYLHADGTAYIKVYEGDGSGAGRATKKDCYQRNWKAAEYLPYVRACFDDVAMSGDIIVARKPRQ